ASGRHRRRAAAGVRRRVEGRGRLRLRGVQAADQGPAPRGRRPRGRDARRSGSVRARRADAARHGRALGAHGRRAVRAAHAAALAAVPDNASGAQEVVTSATVEPRLKVLSGGAPERRPPSRTIETTAAGDEGAPSTPAAEGLAPTVMVKKRSSATLLLVGSL